MKVGRKILVLSVLALAFFGQAAPALAATQTKSGSLDLSATVPGPPPSTAPTIDSPTTGDSFDHQTITVRGSCVVGLVVKIYRNNLFAGATICRSDGTYTLTIDLYVGRNDLFARQYDSLNQPSPRSNIVVVYYKPVGPSPTPVAPVKPGTSHPIGTVTPTNGKSPAQLSILYDYTQIGAGLHQQFKAPLRVIGGTTPYAVSIDWNDGDSSVFSRPNSDKFIATHTFGEPGIYVVKARAADAQGRHAFLQFVVIVGGKVTVKKPPTTTVFGHSTREIWPLIIGIAVASLAIGLVLGVLLQKWKAKRRVD